jgi:uncharacterized membrane protein
MESTIRERLIGQFLNAGTLMASSIIVLGLVAALVFPSSPPPGTINGSAWLINAGVALFIILPNARVGLMLCMFLYKRDYLFAAISACVLTMLVAGFWLGA